MTPKRAKRRSEADFWAQISMRFPREFRRPIKFALLRPAPIFVAEKDRPREDDLFDRSSPVRASRGKRRRGGNSAATHGWSGGLRPRANVAEGNLLHVVIIRLIVRLAGAVSDLL